MSNPQQDDPLESEALFGGSPPLNEQTLSQPDPLTKPDPETVPPAPPIPDPDEISLGEEEDDEEEGEEIDEEAAAVSSAVNLHIEPPMTDSNVSALDVTLASPTGRRGGPRRKKGKGKGKGKSNAKKLQAIEEKLKILRLNLNPVRFAPQLLLDFGNHEKLLKKLGLWDFVHIDFDRTIRADFIAQLVANYNRELRCSYVNGYRFKVNRADLARALKLPLKKEKGNVGGTEVDLEWEGLSEGSIEFVTLIMSDWVLLHEDMWLMPDEVADWMKLIKEGHPEKVDWAGLLWFMVEKELKKEGQLTDCYYASHLQHLIKFQREDLFLIEEPVKDEVESVADDMEDGHNEEKANESNDEKARESDAVERTVEGREGGSVVEGPSTELTLGQDSEKEEGVKDLEMMDAEKCRDSDEEGGEEEHEHEQEQWLLNGKNKLGEHFMQRCSAENDQEFGVFDDCKDQEEEMIEEEDGEEEEEEEDDGEEVARNDYNVFPNDNDALEGDVFTGNFLLGMEGNQMAFTSQEQLHNASAVDARADVQQHISSEPSFFNNSGKRVMEYDYDAVNDTNKRLRINESWDNKPADFGMCMEQIQQMAQRARMLYEEKEQAVEQSSMNYQILLNELEKRDAMIDHLHKSRLDESQKKDFTISRLERELYIMGGVLDGYRKAFKETKKAFAEYREKVQLSEEPLYKDAGPGGLMLTATEIERRRIRREEEFKMNCLYLEQRMKVLEEEYVGQFDEYVEKMNVLDKRLMGLEADAKELIVALHSKRKTPAAEEVAETPPPQEEEEAIQVPDREERMPEDADRQPSPRNEEEEVADPISAE